MSEDGRRDVARQNLCAGEDQDGDEEEGGMQGEGEKESTVASLPLISEAWLCRPNITLLDADLKASLRDGRIHNLLSAEGADIVDALVEQREAVPA